MEEIVRLERVSRKFGEASIKAVDEVSLTIRHGEFLILQGPSGSGKSTLLNLIGGVDRPDKGRVIIEGREPRGRREWAEVRAKKIGFIFQAFNLLPTLTALENVEIPMFGVVKDVKERRQRAEQLLERVGLAHRMNHRPNEMSGGECQRVAIARGLANSPVLILADEPTGNLDSKSSLSIMELLRSIYESDNKTVVMVTHEARFASYATRVLMYEDGRVISDSIAETQWE